MVHTFCMISYNVSTIVYNSANRIIIRGTIFWVIGLTKTFFITFEIYYLKENVQDYLLILRGLNLDYVQDHEFWQYYTVKNIFSFPLKLDGIVPLIKLVSIVLDSVNIFARGNF
jgi:hypothetical protein